nr:carbamoyltransferase HypF [Syntrophobotulus glycolicus]
MAEKALKIQLKGIVQGVGFRPFVYRTAADLGIKGWVGNTGAGLDIHAEGKNRDDFLRRVLAEAPQLARIVSCQKTEVPAEDFKEFTILSSENSGERDVLISPDVATCGDCLKELFDPADRRYQYPFINCTNCGPRYTIIKDRPYDRPRTTMGGFPLCAGCREEYEHPLNRRFHAQPVACKICGPQVALLDNQGREIADKGIGTGLLEAGAILAVKGLGGFHLVCDAGNTETVKKLRQLKERGSKPFALMARDLAAAQKAVRITKLEEELLSSPAAPIVILSRLRAEKALAAEVAPGVHTLGIMLPYTPLHHLLFKGAYDFLVMTSANLSGMPLIYENERALEELGAIADYFLIHNRDIFHPCDDSVVQVVAGAPLFMRRARGYVPLPVLLEENVEIPAAALGGEMKNAFCLAKGHYAFVSQYIGDMHGYENFQRFKKEYRTFQDAVHVYPRRIIYDFHPGYMTTKFAGQTDLPKLAVQHHHAHMISAAGEQRLKGKVWGIICDGTGYGLDGKIWGFEFLSGDASGFERKAHLEYLPLPGGDAGAKHPLRIAYAYLKKLGQPADPAVLDTLFANLSLPEKNILEGQLKSGLNVFDTSSAGRLFDVVSALLGICTEVTYEGQAAIELESTAWNWLNSGDEAQEKQEQIKAARRQMYEEAVKQCKEQKNAWGKFDPQGGQAEQDMAGEKQGGRRPEGRAAAGSDKRLYQMNYSRQEALVLKLKSFLSRLAADIIEGKHKGEIAFCFHLSIAAAILETIGLLGAEKEKIVISGGVFQNKLLTELLLDLARELEIKIDRHRELPCGDGGIAFGQVLIGQKHWQEGPV